MNAMSIRILFTLFLSSVCLGSSVASAQSVARHTMTTWWPSSPGAFHSFDVALRLNSSPDVSFHGSSVIQRFRLQQGAWGSVGLKTHRTGVAAWFAMDGALEVDASGGPCDLNAAPCTHRDGSSMGALVPYAWEQGATYRVRVWASTWDTRGTWWSASLSNETSRTEVFLGRIRVPRNFGLLDGVTSSAIETYDNFASNCGQLGYVSVLVANPTYNNGAVSAAHFQNNIAPGLCDSAVSVLNNSMRHEVGVR